MYDITEKEYQIILARREKEQITNLVTDFIKSTFGSDIFINVVDYQNYHINLCNTKSDIKICDIGLDKICLNKQCFIKSEDPDSLNYHLKLYINNTNVTIKLDILSLFDYIIEYKSTNFIRENRLNLIQLLMSNKVFSFVDMDNLITKLYGDYDGNN